MISGTILTMTGQPAAGLKVKAFDEDDPTGGKDDFMGEAVTDTQGRYSIGPYAGIHWDTEFPGSTSWRPDIYIKVYQIIGGRWVCVMQSETHEDHRHAYNLTINGQLTGILGFVRDTNGAMVSGALVRAFDHDRLIPGMDSGHDFMNEVRTESNGNFMMLYEGKDWDTRIPGSTSWRPDIFVEVHDTVRGRSIKINGVSEIAENAMHSRNHSFTPIVPPRGAIDYIVRDPGDASLNVLAYNIYMRPALTFNDGQSVRVPWIANEILKDHYDVLVFCEAFDDDLRRKLRDRLAGAYPHAAKVPESGDPMKQDGGVKILSRWDIENGTGEHRLFGLACLREDCLAEKGVVYVRINKNGRKYHIFGAHLQAEVSPAVPPGGTSAVTSRTVRRAQLNVIRKFIDDMKIPATEAVIIAGDLNVDRYGQTGEYNEMLQILNADSPAIQGQTYSIDGKLNDLGDHGGKQQLLDYVLYSKGHRPPRAPITSNTTFTRVMFYRADGPWGFLKPGLPLRWLWDISDHYPVFGHIQFEQVQMQAVPATFPAVQPPALQPAPGTPAPTLKPAPVNIPAKPAAPTQQSPPAGQRQIPPKLP
jgi:sphingomyelin phosphodiesterase